MNKINWKVRARNPLFWVNLLAAVALPVLGYFGLTGADFTTWGMVWDTLLRAVSNPYVCALAVVGAWNAVNDPTTRGVADSTRALTYQQPQ